MAGLLDHALATPEKPAVVFGDGDYVETYGELEARSRRIALALRRLGLRPGDCVALLVGNRPPVFDLYWATQRIALYLTPLNHHATPDELAYILQHCDARALIASAEFATLARAACATNAGSLHWRLSIEGEIADFDALEPLTTSIDPDAPLDEQSAGSVIVYSSGTTGRPKGIRRPLPGRAFDDPKYVDATTLVMRTFGFRGDDVYLCPAPLYHAAPLRSCTAMQMLGASVVVMHRFDATAALQAMERHGVTVAQFVPTHFKRLLDLPERVRSSFHRGRLRRVVHAAAPCPPDIKRAMIGWWGPIVLEYYAGTEGGGVLIDSAQWLAHPGSVGKVWDGLSVAILDDGGTMVSTPRKEGPIYFRNHPGFVPNFTYYKDPEATAAAYRGEWFTLGDIGYFDEDGFLFLTDRASNMIISGGVNVYPQEAENVLAAHPKVRDVAVIGVPDADMGEAVKAVVVAAEGIVADDALAEELIACVRARLAHYKCPRSVDFVSTLPRTPTGKLQKRLVREPYWRS